ncbi:hypothetical protein [Prosthecobacter sp.]|uniref:hypothetical protein n=1 Tax=Prosthecobacter sp. TaxID=1965333 RepID=UPI003784382B
MNNETTTLQLQFVRGIWLGGFESPFGIIELVLEGTSDAPNPAQLAAIEAFLPTAAATIKRLRRKLLFGFLQCPIRFAVNNQNRVAVQFRNRINGSQGRLLFADE